ncbi:hypothetical protein MMC07_000739 [Pseudocyphellaria aurata]|nr:hypothetical protein [Pseudocyphellaria aurata]
MGPSQAQAPAEDNESNRRRLLGLTMESLYVILFRRPGASFNNFHWGLYLHLDAYRGGYKYHIINDRPGSWITSHGLTMGAMTSPKLVGLFRVADIDPAKRDRIQQLIQAEDDILNSIEEFSCLEYVERALGRLRAFGYVSYPSWPELEHEIFRFANVANFPENRDKQPVLGFSALCGLMY